MLVKPRGQEAAEALRHELGLGYRRVDVFAAIRQLDYEIYRGPFTDDQVDGALRQQGGVRFIFVNGARAITRQRFTAAHELGHARLEPLADGAQLIESDVESRDNSVDERDANIFAAYFLMDARGVRDLVEGLADERKRVAAVSSAFEVSPKTAAIHLRDLGLISSGTKDELCAGLDSGRIKPRALLTEFDYPMAPTVPVAPAQRLDPAHRARALVVYQDGGFTLAGLADALTLTVDETRSLLRREQLEVRDEPAQGAAEPNPAALTDLRRALG